MIFIISGYFFILSKKIIDKTENSKYNNICYGEVAQLARATGSYPVGREFESPPRYQNLVYSKFFYFLD